MTKNIILFNFVPNVCPLCAAFVRPTFESTFYAGDTYRCKACGAYYIYVKTETLIEFVKQHSDFGRVVDEKDESE